jgi:hypothetical protein
MFSGNFEMAYLEGIGAGGQGRGRIRRNRRLAPPQIPSELPSPPPFPSPIAQRPQRPENWNDLKQAAKDCRKKALHVNSIEKKIAHLEYQLAMAKQELEPLLADLKQACMQG